MASTTRRWLPLLLAAVLGWLFWRSLALLPLRLLVVVFHEAGHALAAVLTGGDVVGIQISPNEGGLTTTAGGWRFLVLNGGYLGSLLFGVVILALGRKPGTGQSLCTLLGLMLLGAALVWFRPILSFGFAYALVVGGALVLLPGRLPVWLTDGFTRFLGVFSVMYALFDIQDDVFRFGFFGGSWYGDGPIRSDAHMLADLTGIPSVIWGLGWIGLGLLTLVLTRKWVA